eukprot:scaffold209385_cov73-Attheya_sp.AAC.1
MEHWPHASSIPEYGVNIQEPIGERKEGVNLRSVTIIREKGGRRTWERGTCHRETERPGKEQKHKQSTFYKCSSIPIC